MSSNSYFYILNNITHFFTYTYFKKLQTTILKLLYQAPPKCSFRSFEKKLAFSFCLSFFFFFFFQNKPNFSFFKTYLTWKLYIFIINTMQINSQKYENSKRMLSIFFLNYQTWITKIIILFAITNIDILPHIFKKKNKSCWQLKQIIYQITSVGWFGQDQLCFLSFTICHT